jgi:uncharacterized protein (DUF427 family)
LSVVLGGVEIAATTRGFRVLETHHAPTYYFPPGDVADGALRPAGGRSVCEWKGAARYFDVIAGAREERRAAWAYPDPTGAFAPIAGFVAFYPGRWTPVSWAMCRRGRNRAASTAVGSRRTSTGS